MWAVAARPILRSAPVRPRPDRGPGETPAGTRGPTMSDTLQVGGSLSGDERITSASGEYNFGVLSDGNLAVGGGSGAQWDADIHDAPGARLDMQADGNLVLYKTDGSPRW